jgi:hypothetical protein
MAIFRGEGGAGASDTNATVSLVTQQAVISTTKASEAAEHATTASTHSDTAAAKATAASASATTAANISAGVAAYANAAIASASSAETAKTNAETAETNAETAESNASTHATTATTKASEAVTSASSASTSASSASSSASTASTHATNAASSASTSATQASNAASSATAAETAKTNAETAETNAETAETNAASSATAAASSATSAATSATSATTQATAAAASASSASTAVTTVVDTYKSTTPTLSSSEVNKITVSNHSSYASPVYIVKLGDAVIQHTIASNVITLVNLSTTATATVTVTVSETEVGKLFSSPASLSMEISDKATTPTVTSSNDREITVTNHSDYPSTPTYVVKIGSTVVTHTDSNGTLTLDVSGTAFTGTQTCTVTANYTGANESLGADVAVDVGGALYRYIRLTGFTTVGTAPFLTRFELYSDLNGSDSNNSSEISGTYIDDESYEYSSTYRSQLAGNTSVTSGWWLLGLAASLVPSAWIRIDQQTNSPALVRSVLIGWRNISSASTPYHSSTVTIQGSNDGTNWTTLKTVTGMTNKSQNSVNL